jgi:hypothetical protein
MQARFFNATTGQIIQFMHGSSGTLTSAFISPASIPTVNQYQTLLKYTKVRLFANYTYMYCQRMVKTLPLPDVGWDIVDSDSYGVANPTLYQLKIKQ